MEKYLDKNNLPTKSGVYLAKGVIDRDKPDTIDVYEHPVKGLSCFADDFQSAGTGLDDEHDCHVSVQFTGLEFIRRVGDLD